MEILLWQPPTIHSVGQVSIEFAGQGELTRITDLYSIKLIDSIEIRAIKNMNQEKAAKTIKIEISMNRGNDGL